MKEVQLKLINTESFDSIEKARKSKVCFLPLTDLATNPLNTIYEDLDTKEDLDELIESIRETGLQQPLIASGSDNGGYVLLSGHRRLKALKQIFSEGVEVKYNDLTVTEEHIPVIIQHVYRTKEEQFKALVASNCYRHISKETNRKLIAEAVKIYNKQLSKGETDPGRTRDNIAKIANVSGRSVQRYVDIGKKGEPVRMKDQGKETNTPEKNTLQDDRKKLIKKMASLENRFTDLETSDFSQEDLKDFKTAAIPLINVIMQRLDIDAGEL
ncbi:MAG: ParB N-terminal domain-containing protein [Erysipelotrichaceae bacterium]|nr:ParB N-terminal domain-containing protein [Erysipelotrichaceae bacterium]